MVREFGLACIFSWLITSPFASEAVELVWIGVGWCCGLRLHQYDVRKGDMVNYQPYPMGRMKWLWGEDAEEFRPQRWLNDDGVFVPQSPFKFTAFQAGPRICLGKEFAYTQMKIYAAAFLFLFQFKLWDELRPVKHRAMLTLQIDEGLCLSALDRTK